MELFSSAAHRWVTITNLLADTGADISVLPRHLGAYLVGNIRRGKPQHIRGVVPDWHAQVYLHHVRCRWDGWQFLLPVAITARDDAPLIFGRLGALDRFTATFHRGRTLDLTRP